MGWGYARKPPLRDTRTLRDTIHPFPVALILRRVAPVHTLWTLWTRQLAYHACVWTGTLAARREHINAAHRVAAGIDPPTLEA